MVAAALVLGAAVVWFGVGAVVVATMSSISDVPLAAPTAAIVILLAIGALGAVALLVSGVLLLTRRRRSPFPFV